MTNSSVISRNSHRITDTIENNSKYVGDQTLQLEQMSAPSEISVNDQADQRANNHNFELNLVDILNANNNNTLSTHGRP